MKGIGKKISVVICFGQTNRAKFKKHYQMLRQNFMKTGVCVSLISKSHLAEVDLISWAGN